MEPRTTKLTIHDPERFDQALAFTEGKIKRGHRTLREAVNYLMTNAKSLDIYNDTVPHSFGFELCYHGRSKDALCGGIILHNANLGPTLTVSLSDNDGMYYGIHT